MAALTFKRGGALLPTVLSAVGLLVVLALAAAGEPPKKRAISVEDPEGAKTRIAEEYIWNLDSKPFHFRLRRHTGLNWTEDMTLEPGEKFAIHESASKTNPLEGATGTGRAFVGIRYHALGGVIQMHLPARDRENEIVPDWFHVKDANGISLMIQAHSVKEARKVQERLQTEPAKTPEQLELIKRVLRQNWVLYDR